MVWLCGRPLEKRKTMAEEQITAVDLAEDIQADHERNRAWDQQYDFHKVRAKNDLGWDEQVLRQLLRTKRAWPNHTLLDGPVTGNPAQLA
jgi:hypothetical protein